MNRQERIARRETRAQKDLPADVQAKIDPIVEKYRKLLHYEKDMIGTRYLESLARDVALLFVAG